jgi:hypothetical protein
MMAVAAHYMAIRSVEGLGDGEIAALLAAGVTISRAAVARVPRFVRSQCL